MPAASFSRAEWLRQAELSTLATSAVMESRWGEDAGDLAQSSLLVELAAADAEAARRMALHSAVRAIDWVEIEGVWPDLVGNWIEIDYAGELGMVGMVSVRVLNARVDQGAGVTEIEVEVAI